MNCFNFIISHFNVIVIRLDLWNSFVVRQVTDLTYYDKELIRQVRRLWSILMTY